MSLDADRRPAQARTELAVKQPITWTSLTFKTSPLQKALTGEPAATAWEKTFAVDTSEKGSKSPRNSSNSTTRKQPDFKRADTWVCFLDSYRLQAQLLCENRALGASASRTLLRGSHGPAPPPKRTRSSPVHKASAAPGCKGRLRPEPHSPALPIQRVLFRLFLCIIHSFPQN